MIHIDILALISAWIQGYDAEIKVYIDNILSFYLPAFKLVFLGLFTAGALFFLLYQIWFSLQDEESLKDVGVELKRGGNDEN